MPKHRIALPIDKIRDLYWTDGLNTHEIAKMLGCSQGTLYKRMLENHIPRRPQYGRKNIISKEELKKLYLEQGLSSRKIAKLCNCAYSTIDNRIKKYGFPIKTLAAAHITTHRKPFNGSIHDKAYLLGFKIGDLRARKMYKNSETISIDCGSTRYDMITHTKALFKEYGHVWISKPSKRASRQIQIQVDDSFSFLLGEFDEFPYWCVSNRKVFLSTLAGFIDAEGCFMTPSEISASFFLGNYQTKILKQIQKFLIKEKINSRYYLSSHKGTETTDGYLRNADYWGLSISRKYDVFKFTSLILPYLRYARKISDAKKVIENIEIRNRKYGFINWPTEAS